MRVSAARQQWKQAVFYQIYPKSFQDSDGDGIGDLGGILQRLDYLAELGVDGIWLSPVCASPQVDNGYDVSDYQAIDPMFGTMEQMKTLIREAKARGISIIMDMVLNHTSDQHRWFREACKSRENPYHDYYVWRDGEPGQPPPSSGSSTLKGYFRGVVPPCEATPLPPNDMRATFGGPAWDWVPGVGQYYFHQFAPQQPDLNWENPKVRQELYQMLLWWMEQGVEGFRLDVIDQIAKEPDKKITGNGPRLHEFLRELSANVFQKGCIVTVGEAWGADVERARLYSAPDGSELSMVFQFEQMVLDQRPGGEKWDLAPLPFVELKRSFARWQTGLHGQGWNSLFWNNHDLPRIVSRWGDDGKYRVQSAKLLATLLHGMEGTPYIYQGEELGMTNIRLPIEAYQDLEIQNLYRERLAAGVPEEEVLASIYAKGRDNARTPMQWDDSPSAGFTTGIPWLPVNPNYQEINAEAALADEDSIFYYYQKLIALRKRLPVLTEGDFTLLAEENEQMFVYLRRTEAEELLVMGNFSGREAEYPLPEGWENVPPLLTNYPNAAGSTFYPWEARMLYRLR
ncbi:MAG: alpha-glucosidase [Clostridiales bacterium]|nr:alpha-glucosidase [Clostridiales bacterium]